MPEKLNPLEEALLDRSNYALDSYLEIEPTKNIRAHIEEIRRKAAVNTDAGKLKERVLAALNS